MKITIKGFVHKNLRPFSKEDEYSFYSSDVSGMDCMQCVMVGPAQFEFELPEAFNPISAEVAVLNKKLDTLADEYHGKVAQIKGRINDLLCLEAPANS